MNLKWTFDFVLSRLNKYNISLFRPNILGKALETAFKDYSNRDIFYAYRVLFVCLGYYWIEN